MGAHRRRHDDEERREGVGGQSARIPARGPGEPDATLLDLQTRAGNTAVTGLLAGDGPTALRYAVQRAGGGEAAAAGKDEGKRPASAMLAIPDLSATIPLLSVVLEGARTGGGTGKAGKQKPENAGDVHVVIALEDMPGELPAAAVSSRMFKTMTIAMARFRIVMTEVMIAAYSVSAAKGGTDTVSITLNASSLSTQNPE